MLRASSEIDRDLALVRAELEQMTAREACTQATLASTEETVVSLRAKLDEVRLEVAEAASSKNLLKEETGRRVKLETENRQLHQVTSTNVWPSSLFSSCHARLGFLRLFFTWMPHPFTSLRFR